MMKIGNIVTAQNDDVACKWNICIGQIAKIDKDQSMNFGIIILDSKEPSVNPDGDYGLNWGGGIRWYNKNQLTLIEN